MKKDPAELLGWQLLILKCFDAINQLSLNWLCFECEKEMSSSNSNELLPFSIEVETGFILVIIRVSLEGHLGLGFGLEVFLRQPGHLLNVHARCVDWFVAIFGLCHAHLVQKTEMKFVN